MIECGGKEPLSLKAGFYYEPTVLTGVTPKMSVMNEEVFGPVAAISVFDNMDEAIALAIAPYTDWEHLCGLRTRYCNANVLATGVRDGMGK